MRTNFVFIVFARPEFTFAFPQARLRSMSCQHDSWLDPPHISAFEHDFRASHEDDQGRFSLRTDVAGSDSGSREVGFAFLFRRPPPKTASLWWTRVIDSF